MGIEFTLTPEQQLLRRTLREFLEREILPSVPEYDRRETFPEENIRKLAGMGYLGLPIPQEYGGGGMGEVEYGILLEEMGRVCSGHATIVGAHIGLCSTPLWLFGTEEQKRRYLPRLARGEAIGAFALTEPEAGSDASNLQLQAKKSGEEYLLRGSKIFITNASRADIIVTFAVTDPALGAAGGVTAFIVEAKYPGFSYGKTERKMGIRASPTGELIFDDCRVPKENILGRLGEGFIVALTTLDGGRAGLAAGAVGAAEAVLEETLRLVKARERMGESILEDQPTQFLLAETGMELFAARYVAYHTLTQVDHYYKMLGRGERSPRPFRERVSLASAMAKAYCSEVASRAVERCLQVHGTLGLTRGFRVEKAFRDSLIAEIYEGTNEIQRLIIAGELLKRGGLG